MDRINESRSPDLLLEINDQREQPNAQQLAERVEERVAELLRRELQQRPGAPMRRRADPVRPRPNLLRARAGGFVDVGVLDRRDPRRMPPAPLQRSSFPNIRAVDVWNEETKEWIASILLNNEEITSVVRVRLVLGSRMVFDVDSSVDEILRKQAPDRYRALCLVHRGALPEAREPGARGRLLP